MAKMTKAELDRRRSFRLLFGERDGRMSNHGQWAPTLKQAVADAKHWLRTGVMRVCVDRRLPSGSFRRVRCMRRR